MDTLLSDMFARLGCGACILALGCAPADGPVDAAPGPPPGPWEFGAPGPVPRFEAPVADVGERILLFGGFADTLMRVTQRVDAYHLVEDSWERLADMPTAVTHTMAAVVGDHVWLAGGFEGAHPGAPVAEVWRYDLSADRWESGPPLPSPRGAGALVAVGTRLHHIGGFGPGRDDSVDDHWSLDTSDPDADWRAEPPLPEARGHMGAVVVDGVIFVVGGQFMHDTWPVDLPNVDTFDPAAGVWSRRASMPSSRSHMEPGLFYEDGLIHVYGGRDNTTSRWAVDDAIVYDIATDRWEQGETLPAALVAPVVRPFAGGLVVLAGSRELWNRPQVTTYRRPN